MNNIVNQATATDAAVKLQPKAQKGKGPDGGEFQSMLADSIDSKEAAKETQKPQGTAKDADNQPQGTAKSADNQPQAADEVKQPEQQPLEEEDNIQGNEWQAAAAAMQSQVMPLIAEATQSEIPEEIAEADGVRPVQEAETPIQATEASAQTEKIITTDKAPLQTEEASAQERQAKDTAQESAAKPMSLPKRRHEAVSAQTAEAIPQGQLIEKTPQGVRQPQQGHEVSKEAATVTTATEIVRHPHPAVEMHNMRRPHETETGQSRFNDMLAKASQKLNPDPMPNETAEITVEEFSIKQPVILEAKPTEQETEIPEAEIKVQEKIVPQEEIKAQDETKPKTAIQKDEKAPVTEQRAQKEISKPDEAVFAMAQPKQPEAVSETAHSEPLQQPQQTQAPDQTERIKAQVIKNLETQKTEFEMQLNPKELGKIDVKMVLENGKLTVEIIAANPKSAELLTKQTESLAASLKAGSIETTTVNVVAAAENASANMDGEYNLNNFMQQNQNQADRRDGRPGGARNSQEQTAANEQNESRQTPQRILNYAV